MHCRGMSFHALWHFRLIEHECIDQKVMRCMDGVYFSGFLKVLSKVFNSWVKQNVAALPYLRQPVVIIHRSWSWQQTSDYAFVSNAFKQHSRRSATSARSDASSLFCKLSIFSLRSAVCRLQIQTYHFSISQRKCQESSSILTYTSQVETWFRALPSLLRAFFREARRFDSVTCTVTSNT
jgi:hypothetical protein